MRSSAVLGRGNDRIVIGTASALIECADERRVDLQPGVFPQALHQGAVQPVLALAHQIVPGRVALRLEFVAVMVPLADAVTAIPEGVATGGSMVPGSS